jgi:hypothetical protein
LSYYRGRTSDEVQGKMPLNRKSPKLPVTYLEALYVHPLMPRAGFETHCSPLFTNVLFVLKKRL